MSNKELEYEVNNFANLLYKDCMNLMECLKKQGEDNKPILYLGKHYQKVILPYEEYQKMYNRLESIDNANPSEAMECMEMLKCSCFYDAERGEYVEDTQEYKIIKNALQKTEKEEKIISGIEDYLNQRIKVESLEDVRKAFIEIRNQLQVIKEVLG